MRLLLLKLSRGLFQAVSCYCKAKYMVLLFVDLSVVIYFFILFEREYPAWRIGHRGSGGVCFLHLYGRIREWVHHWNSYAKLRRVIFQKTAI
jgi:hypothetical protein